LLGFSATVIELSAFFHRLCRLTY